MARANSRFVFPTIATAIGALWVAVGLSRYGWISDGKPSSGFFPVIVGALLAAIGIVAIVSELKIEPPRFFSVHLHPLLATVAVVVFALLVGFFPALSVYVFGWLKAYEKYTWRFSLLVTVVTIALVYGVFAAWLRVPFPRGFIMDALRG